MTFASAGGSVHALDDISIDVRDGEFLSLIGPSGCGKSTMLRLIGDLLVPTAGSVTVRDKSARQARLDREYGMVFQSSTLLEWRKVAANV
ncbi:MAG: ATP-binding cassette domain-containing protein, partial [Acidimicrobiia bacterium]|nr:ATP-binding cassette domain-containing protein [Acidimicrobiia bacterium]